MLIVQKGNIKPYLLQPEALCPAETTTSWDSLLPLCESSFFNPMIPASTKASLDTIKALPARRAKAPKAKGTMNPPIRSGMARSGASFLRPLRCLPSSRTSVLDGNLTCKRLNNELKSKSHFTIKPSTWTSSSD